LLDVGIALKELKLLTRNVGHCGSMDVLNAPDEMQTQEGMREKPVQVTEISIAIKR